MNSLLSCLAAHLLPAPRPATPASDAKELGQLVLITAVSFGILFTAKALLPF